MMPIALLRKSEHEGFISAPLYLTVKNKANLTNIIKNRTTFNYQDHTLILKALIVIFA